MKLRSALLSVAVLGCGLATTTTAMADIVVHRPAVVVTSPYVVVAPAPYVVRPAARYCAYGCSGSATVTGPSGNTVTRSGSAGCSGGTCTRSGTITGPAGESVTFRRSVSR